MQSLFLSLIGFACVAAGTPGPNNIMVMSSGATFGFRRTVPHLLGIALGHGLMVVLIVLGIGEVFLALPALHDVLRVLAAFYMLWLAWKIAHADAPGTGENTQPFTFLQAAAFQWVNPKAWAMSLGAATIYGSLGAGLMGAVFVAIDLIAVAIWTGLGQSLSHWLGTGARLRAFNRVMAGLLVASIVLVFAER